MKMPVERGKRRKSSRGFAMNIILSEVNRNMCIANSALTAQISHPIFRNEQEIEGTFQTRRVSSPNASEVL